jgi:DNA-binding MarR family transcriptional regulator
MNPAAFLPLHPIEFRILMALASGPNYGARIVRHVEDHETQVGKLYPANLFRRIRDMLERELLEEAARPADADARRTYVQLTTLGRAVARAEALRLEALVRDARDLDLVEGG